MPASSRRGVALLICAVAVSVLLAAGCDDDDDDGELTATLRGVSASGTASFEARGDGIEIAVEVEADDIPPGLHANHVHHGSCANEGEIHVPLVELGATSDGVAERKTEWLDDNLGHFATGHYVDIHVRSTADGVGVVIMCGNVS